MKKRISLVVALAAVMCLTSAEAQTEDFFKLVLVGTPESVQTAIKQGADVNARVSDDWTPLMNAALSNPKAEIVAALLKAGANVNARNSDGTTALMLAAGFNANPAVISTLLKAGADANARTTNGLTPLMFAAGFSMFEKPWGMSIIHLTEKPDPTASKETDQETLDSDGTPTYSPPNKEPPLPEVDASDLGAASPTMKMRPVPLRGTDLPPSTEHNLKAITMLIKAGADINARDENGFTALAWAAANNQKPEAVTAILKAGSSPKDRLSGDGTVLMVAAGKNPNPQVVVTLVKAGGDLRAKDGSGMTALMFAAEYNENPEVILTLLKVGADAKAKDEGGKTAFDHAQANANVKGTDAYWKLNDARY